MGRSGFTEAICQLVREKNCLLSANDTEFYSYMSSALCSVPTPKTAVNYELIPLYKSGEDNH